MIGDVILDREQTRTEWASIIRNEQALDRCDNIDRRKKYKRQYRLKQEKRRIIRNAARLGILAELGEISSKILRE